MRKLLKLAIVAGIAYGAKMAYDNFRAAQGPVRSKPGDEDRSFGPAVDADQ